jgi:cobalamin biosynthesis Mg chelatase CobN
VLALLAFACVPALAQAECTDSSCKQYEVEIPTSGGKEHKHSNSGGGTEPTAHASTPNKPKSGGGGSDTPKSGAENETEEKQAGAGGGGGGNGGNGPANQGNSPGGGNSGGEAGLGEEKAVGGTETGKPASHSSGGSSPLVPILIAIAVLAAISIGAVIYRQRRQDGGGSGSPVSPKAG